MFNENMQPQPRPPEVSVIIPAYNTAGHIGGALESVFAQTFTEYEVIVINDGSPDTEQMERAIQPYISRILYFKQENGGPSSARNAGIRRARGEWLAFLDSDDVWLPQYLAEQIGFLKGDAGLDMVYCDAVLQGDNKSAGTTFMQLYPSTGPVTFESLLVEQTQVITSGTVARREKVMAAGLFDESLHCSEDHDLWLRISHAGGRIAYQRRVLLRRNLRAGSQGSATESLLTGEMQSLTKLNRDLDLSSATRALLVARLRSIQAELVLIEGKAYLLEGNRDKAYESLSRAHAYAPTVKLRAVLAGLRIAPSWVISAARFWRRRKSHATATAGNP
jgi:glycosyltransferase involved in cell wall biosynthesis